MSTSSCPLRQKPDVLAVLIHDREPLDALLLCPGLVDEDDVGVEVALLAGELLIDLIGDDVADTAPVLPARREALTGELPPRRYVPQAELGDDASVGTLADVADDERVGLDRAPIGKARRCVYVAHLLQERGAVERPEQTRMIEIGGDDVGDVGRELGIGPEEDRNGDRNRRDRALRLPPLQSAAGSRRRIAAASAGRGIRRLRAHLAHLAVETAALRRSLVAVVGALRERRRGDEQTQQRGQRRREKAKASQSVVSHGSNLRSRATPDQDHRCTSPKMTGQSNSHVTVLQAPYLSAGNWNGAHCLMARMEASAAIE